MTNELKLPLTLESVDDGEWGMIYNVVDNEGELFADCPTLKEAQAIITAMNHFDKAVELLEKIAEPSQAFNETTLRSEIEWARSNAQALLQSIQEQKK